MLAKTKDYGGGFVIRRVLRSTKMEKILDFHGRGVYIEVHLYPSFHYDTEITEHSCQCRSVIQSSTRGGSFEGGELLC